MQFFLGIVYIVALVGTLFYSSDAIHPVYNTLCLCITSVITWLDLLIVYNNSPYPAYVVIHLTASLWTTSCLCDQEKVVRWPGTRRATWSCVQQTRGTDIIPIWCWASVEDVDQNQIGIGPMLRRLWLLLSQHSIPANTRRWVNAVLMLGRRRRRRANIKASLGQRFVLAGIEGRTQNISKIIRSSDSNKI